MQEPVDRAAMIEAASRSLRQQIHRGGVRDRPRSKGSLHDGQAPNGSGNCSGQGVPEEPRAAENAQRRIRSAENQHRTVSASRDGPQTSHTVAPTPSASALDNYPLEDDVEEDSGTGYSNIEDVHKIWSQDFHQELKRPLSRKKDPSASAAAGLGAFSGPARMTDAFEQRKTRQPIPVESWGPRPPSRAGLPQKGSAADSGLGDSFVSTPSRGSGAGSSVGKPISKGGDQAPGSRPSSKVGGEQSRATSKAGKADGEQALGAKVVGGTWAAARAEPRVMSETRRGRERKAPNRDRGSPEVGYATDLGVFGCGTRAPNQQLTKSLSGVFDHHSNQFRGPNNTPLRNHVSGLTESWADASGALEVSGCALGDHAAGAWPGSPAQSCGGSPPTRKGARHSSLTEPMQMEDVEADQASLHASFRRGSDMAMTPQVIVTRSHHQSGHHQSQGPRGVHQSRSQVRRGTEQRVARERERAERSMPFSTSLDVDFLSLFAS
eukprot:TRINITY_DN62808_c0_g1_i1.p1 TRINITY_DN62808_c0_g1~~TRINITY_DN62808_c0_g1_i1.p1  ORF type:complete len:493 (+),score=69.65 TRINITY_DN62808_c0_g1_i1:149-1627(+)